MVRPAIVEAFKHDITYMCVYATLAYAWWPQLFLTLEFSGPEGLTCLFLCSVKMSVHTCVCLLNRWLWQRDEVSAILCVYLSLCFTPHCPSQVSPKAVHVTVASSSLINFQELLHSQSKVYCLQCIKTLPHQFLISVLIFVVF